MIKYIYLYIKNKILFIKYIINLIYFKGGKSSSRLKADNLN